MPNYQTRIIGQQVAPAANPKRGDASGEGDRLICGRSTSRYLGESQRRILKIAYGEPNSQPRRAYSIDVSRIHSVRWHWSVSKTYSYSRFTTSWGARVALRLLTKSRNSRKNIYKRVALLRRSGIALPRYGRKNQRIIGN